VALFASILVSFLVGLFLVFAPWTHLWDANSLLQPHSALRSLLLNTFHPRHRERHRPHQHPAGAQPGAPVPEREYRRTVVDGRQRGRNRMGGGDEVDALFGELMQAGESVPRLREVLRTPAASPTALLVVLRRAVPRKLLELLGTSPPWSEDVRLLGGVVLNPRTPTPLSLRLMPSLYWHDLAEAAANPRLLGPVRVRAEAVLAERLPDLKPGEKITLGRLATPFVLLRLLADEDARVVQTCLQNPRLREDDLAAALRRERVAPALLAEVAGSSRWKGSYRVRLELVLQPRTPLALSLAQLSGLVPGDLSRVAGTPDLPPLVQIAAQRLLERGET
jgi:hypothetical protein